MPYTAIDALEGLKTARRFFLKHLDGLRDDQWDWKPYPECKSIRETLSHLIIDDMAALYSLETGREPQYESYTVEETEVDALLARLADTREKLLDLVRTRYADAALDTEISVWGSPMPLAQGLGYLTSEDFYHAGQVAFIRMATDPAWDYYGNVYGG